jgi:hypothetical protein
MEHYARMNGDVTPLGAEEAFYDRHGYMVLPKVVPTQLLEQLYTDLTDEFQRAQRAGELFTGGGMISGHLNCFPGVETRAVYHALETAGVIDLIKELSAAARRKPNVGCNFNLPASGFQNHHVDGYAAQPFMICNVAVVRTTAQNGAIELSPGSHKRAYKYWQFACARHPAVRIELDPGDVLLRPSTLWHRGMPNRSQHARPMLGFTWEDGGSHEADPFTIHGGRIRFLPNRYGQSLGGRARERAFATLPRLGGGYLFLRSLLR